MKTVTTNFCIRILLWRQFQGESLTWTMHIFLLKKALWRCTMAFKFFQQSSSLMWNLLRCFISGSFKLFEPDFHQLGGKICQKWPKILFSKKKGLWKSVTASRISQSFSLLHMIWIQIRGTCLENSPENSHLDNILRSYWVKSAKNGKNLSKITFSLC